MTTPGPNQPRRTPVTPIVVIAALCIVSVVWNGWRYLKNRHPTPIDNGISLVLRVDTSEETPEAKRRVVAATQDVIRHRLDDLGLASAVVRKHGETGDQIFVLVPFDTDLGRVKGIVLSAARLEIKLVEGGPAPDERSLMGPLATRVPDGTEVVPGPPAAGSASREYYLVKQTADLTSADIRAARPVLDELNLPAVGVTLRDDAVSKFARLTGENVGRQLAIILDGVVQSAPRIEAKINTADLRITGTFTKQEAADLALILRTGALPARVTLIEQGAVK